MAFLFFPIRWGIRGANLSTLGVGKQVPEAKPMRAGGYGKKKTLMS